LFLIIHKDLQVETAKVGTRPVSSVAFTRARFGGSILWPVVYQSHFSCCFIFVGWAQKQRENDINWHKKPNWELKKWRTSKKELRSG